MLKFPSLSLFCLSIATLVACGDDGAGAAGAGGEAGAGAQAGSGGTAQGGGGAGGSGGAQGGGGAGGTGGAQGGGGSGGMGTGGTGAGGVGAGGTGGSGGASPAAECTQDSDCYTNSDCCECAAHPVGELPQACAIDCLIDTCASKGVDATSAVCAAGQCVTVANCDESTVKCDVPTPQCPLGEVPIVKGTCYPGGCMPATQCAEVTSCDSCDQAGVACVHNVSQLPQTHCVDAQGCDPADCDCLGNAACVGSFSICNDAAVGIECVCPVCAL